MKLDRALPFLICLLSLLSNQQAAAGFISIETTTRVTVDSATEIVSMDIDLTNKGDDTAHEVGMMIPVTGETRHIAERFAPGESAAVALSVGFENMAMAGSGVYSLPFRILYKDANFHAYSIAVVPKLQLGAAPLAVISAEINKEDDYAHLELNDTASIPVGLKNLSSSRASIESLSFFGPAELSFAADVDAFPMTMEAGGELDVWFRVVNAGARLESDYAVPLVINGSAAGKHFSEVVPYRIKIVSGAPDGRKIFRVLLLIIAAGVAASGIRAWVNRKGNG